MRISRLEVSGFRNLEHSEIEPIDGFNIVTGQNGQGKTNLMEAIYWLATLRPFRTNRLRELITWSENASVVRADIENSGLLHRLEVRITDGQRHAYREQKKVRSTEYFGDCSVVLFTPDDVGIVRGTPERRRRLIDRAIFTTHPKHMNDFVSYRRALDSRNKLLRQGMGNDVLLAYEETLARLGAQLIQARSDFIEALSPVFEDNLNSILGPSYSGCIKYRPSVGAKDDLINALLSQWDQDRVKDRERGFTQRGPHADDITFNLLGHNAKSYASQGQQRALILAVKIAQIQVLKNVSKIVPILLLDDVSSEFDALRNESLFQFLNSFEGQVFITTTDPAYLRISGERKTFTVHDGRINPEEN